MTTSDERSVPKPVFTDAEAGAKTFPDSTSRRFNYYTPEKRKQTHYEDVTVEVQPDRQTVEVIVACVTAGLSTPGVQCGSGRE